jgi:hypothetical protein
MTNLYGNITREDIKFKRYWKARQKVMQHNLFRKYRGQKIPFFTAYLKARADASEIILGEMNQK